MDKSSALTFKDLTENLNYIKIIYNNEIIYDDTTEQGESLEHLHNIEAHYAKKKIYKMIIDVVHFHHCILTIIGE